MTVDQSQFGGRARIPQLDLLRGIAVLMVMLFHYPLFNVFRIGWAGVDLFFVLSGFLISGLLFTDWKRNGRIRVGHFLLRRGFKIYPAFYFLLISMLAPTLIFRIDHPLERVGAELFFLQDYFPHIWTHTWSLAVEEQFYLLLPLLLLILGMTRKRDPFRSIPYLAIGLIALCLALRVARHPSESEQVQYAFHLRADTLFAGVALGYLFHFRPKIFNDVSRLPLLAVAIVALIPLFCFRSGSDAPWVLTCNLIGFVAVVWWIVPRSNIRMPLLEKVGVYSYSIYLWHFPVALPLVLIFSRMYRLHWLLLYVVVSIAVGIYMSRLVEMPILLKRDECLERPHTKAREVAPTSCGSAAAAQA